MSIYIKLSITCMKYLFKVLFGKTTLAQKCIINLEVNCKIFLLFLVLSAFAGLPDNTDEETRIICLHLPSPFSLLLQKLLGISMQPDNTNQESIEKWERERERENSSGEHIQIAINYNKANFKDPNSKFISVVRFLL